MNKHSVTTPLLLLVLSTAFLVVLWFSFATILASAKGFETTDEALYLLVSRELQGNVQWGFPAGWHTAPLYLLSGEDVSNFRTLGAVSLALLGMILGVASFLVTSDVKDFRALADKRSLLSVGLFAVVGLSGSLLYYASLLRAPSYNWVNLTGLLIACIGVLLIVWKGNDYKILGTRRPSVFFPVLVGFGLFYSFPGRPSSPFLFLVFAIPILILCLGWRKGSILTAQIAVSGILMIPVAVLVGIWPADFYSYFVNAVTTPPLRDTSSVSVASLELASFPHTFGVALFADTFSGGLLLAAMTAGTLAFLIPRKRAPLMLILGSVGGILILWHFALRDFTIHGEANIGSWARADTGVALMILYLLSMTLFFLSGLNASRDEETSWSRRKVLQSSLLLGWVPIIFGFGSSNPLIGMASHAGIGLLLASMMLLTAARPAKNVLLSQGPIALVAIALTGLVISDSHTMPYRLAPMADQTTRLELLDGGSSVLYVDSKTAEYYKDVLSALEENGFVAGKPLISLEWTWSSALPYASGASVLPSAMPTMFGHPGSLERLDSNLQQGCVSFDCENAWVTMTNPDSLELQSADDIEAAQSRILERTRSDSMVLRVLIFQSSELYIYKPEG